MSLAYVLSEVRLLNRQEWHLATGGLQEQLLCLENHASRPMVIDIHKAWTSRVAACGMQ
jgi:hypothetical protein